MRQLRFSLFSKIMLWFFLNLLLLGAIFWLIFNLNFRFEGNSPFFGGASNRIETVARLINQETNEKSREERDTVLKTYSENYKAEFFLFDNQGKQIGGRDIVLPPEIAQKITFEPSLPSVVKPTNPPPRPRFGFCRRFLCEPIIRNFTGSVCGR
jgi:two-component system, OmpR family, sensor histidine kinase CpxA